MNMVDHKLLICIEALRRAYLNAVRTRSGNPKWFREYTGGQHYLMLKEVASSLESPKLATLFVDSQFNAMPTDWCVRTFAQPFPPFNACFGGEAITRYRNFIDEGINAPSTGA
jgi:hypothetical protein